MAGLPKKYAQMGFKKGWAAFKRSKGTTKRKTTKVIQTAKRKSYSRRVATRSRRKSGMTNRLLQIDIGRKVTAGVYGAARGYLNAINPLNKVLGGYGAYSDEIAMFVAAQGIKALVPSSKKYMETAQDIESFLIGFQASQGMKGGSNNKVGAQGVTYN